MHIYPLTAIVLIAALPGPALAACFTPQDLGRGITVQMVTGDTIVMRRTNAGLIAVTENFGSDEVSVRFTGAHGLYFIEEMDVQDGRVMPETRLQIVFDPETGMPPPPALGLSWTGRTTNIFSDGYRRDEVFSVKFSKMTPMTISDCTYDMIRADIRYEWPSEEDSLDLVYAYLPELDSAFLLSSDPSAGPDSFNQPAAFLAASK